MEQIGFFGDIGCKEGLSAGDKRSMENRIYAWMKEQGQELTAHQIAIGMCPVSYTHLTLPTKLEV